MYEKSSPPVQAADVVERATTPEGKLQFRVTMFLLELLKKTTQHRQWVAFYIETDRDTQLVPYFSQEQVSKTIS